MRTNFDFTPYRRSTVGFDRLFDLLETGLRSDAPDSYPPFDIVKDSEDSYRITLAVAGFRPDEIEVVAQQNQLTVTGTARRGSSAGRISASRHRRAPVRAALPARRFHRGRRCPLRKRPALDRAEARRPRGDEAAQDRNRRRQGGQRSDRRAQGQGPPGGLIRLH